MQLFVKKACFGLSSLAPWSRWPVAASTAIGGFAIGRGLAGNEPWLLIGLALVVLAAGLAAFGQARRRTV